MDFRLDDDQKKLRQYFKDLCESEIMPHAVNVDEQAVIPEGNWKALSEFGYLGLGLDPEHSGKGHSLLLWTVFGEDLARCCASTFVSGMASSQIFGALLQKYGTDQQKEKYLPGIISGVMRGAVAATDPKGAPSQDPTETAAEKKGDGAIINGVKPYVTNGPVCDAILVSAITDAESDPKAQTVFLIESDAQGFTRGERTATVGTRGCPFGPVFLENCEAGKQSILGEWNGAGPILSDLTTLWRIWWSVYAIGLGQASIDAAIAYSTSREINGKRISKHQEVHFKIAEMHMMNDSARQLLYKAAWLIDEGQKAGIIAASAKLLATESATMCSHKAMQIHGAKGYIAGSNVERYYRDVRLGEIVGETSEVLRGILAEDSLEEFAID